LQACALKGEVIFAVGVGPGVSPFQINQIATDLPGRQTAFLINDFDELSGLVNLILAQMSPLSLNQLRLALPDQCTVTLTVDLAGDWNFDSWTVQPGVNHFEALVDTLRGERTETVEWIGLLPCPSICGDMTGDAFVGLGDVAAFQRCFGTFQYDAPDCACGDLNGDAVIDLDDWTAFQAVWASPTLNHPPDCP
jgi:hypothetical protein